MSPGSISPPASAAVEPLHLMGREELHQMQLVMSRDWLETDGRGGYASSTAILCPTRRYHGLLVCPYPGNPKRHVFLSRFEETLHGAGKSFPLSIARYPGLWQPHGHRSLESFRLIPYPSWRYEIGRSEVVRDIMMVRGSPIVLMRYRLESPVTDVELRLRPLLPFRDADSLTWENLELNPRVERIGGGIRCRPYHSLPEISITCATPGAGFDVDPVWYRDLEYQMDLRRGYDGVEDQFSPGCLRIPLRPGVDCYVAATIDAPVENPDALFQEERARRVQELPQDGDTLGGRLELAAEQFLYEDPHGRTGVIAGFPWFAEWGRDTFIALPGLTLARGQVERCADALSGALRYLHRGLMPNIFGAAIEDSHYGSADASLWFARAVHLYEAAGGSSERIIEEFLPALRDIARWYTQGTDLDIRVDDSGLVWSGSETLNATWMDARASDGPVTPRYGYAVEMNALWYSLLRQLERLCLTVGVEAEARQWMSRRRQLSRSFLRHFWLEKERYLADCYRDGQPDKSIRPNMIIAAALEYSPLTRGKRTDIVQCVESELLTPRGLRTLAPEDPDYQGRYEGNQDKRDRAYHQGTVWPWLLGFYAEAYLRAYGRRKKRIAVVRGLVEGFAEQLGTQGVGQLSEVFDGDPPHRPGGAFAQAWSVAELLRTWRLTAEDQER